MNGQTTANQVRELEQYIAASGWTLAGSYLDEGISAAKESRPALDRLVKDAKRRRFDAVVCWSLDRMARSLKHLITLLDEFQALTIAFVSLREGLDWSTPAGKLHARLFAMISEFERLRIAERVRSGMARAKAQGKNVGRPRVKVTDADLAPRTIRAIRAVLRSALSDAVKWRLVTYNAAKAASLPRVKRFNNPTLTPAQARAFVSAAEDHRLGPL